MKKGFLSVFFIFFVFSSFAITIEEETISIENTKPLDCTITSGSGTGLSATASTCEDAADYLALMEEVYWEQ